MLSGKCVVVGVCGGIAAYKTAAVVSGLKKLGAEVHVIMTQAAQEFVGKLTFQTLSQNLVTDEMFAEPRKWDVEHVELAQKADLLLIAPATANTIAKLAHGFADNMLTCVALATEAPLLLAPAMNKNMYENPATVDNLQALASRGCKFVEPGEGFLACGATGKGRMSEPEQIIEAVIDEIAFDKDLRGLRVLVSAGATQEPIDPVRYITNHSSGKMGYAVARAAKRRGADVALVSGHTSLAPVQGVKTIQVGSAQEMHDAILENSANCDIIVKAAAVADYTPARTAEQKLKKSQGGMEIALRRTPDILQELGAKKPNGQVLVGFCMETQDLLLHAKEKLERKRCDYIVANNLFTEGAGFGVDTNTVTILGSDGSVQEPGILSKDSLAHVILDLAKKKYDEENGL